MHARLGSSVIRDLSGFLVLVKAPDLKKGRAKAKGPLRVCRGSVLHRNCLLLATLVFHIN